MPLLFFSFLISEKPLKVAELSFDALKTSFLPTVFCKLSGYYLYIGITLSDYKVTYGCRKNKLG